MEKKNCYASLGTLLLLRVAVAASLVACVWAHREDSDDHDHHHHHHNHDHDRGEERGSLVITILKFYAIVTGIALVLIALGAIAFTCCSLCCLRCGKGIKGDSGAITNKDGKDHCKLGPQKVGGVICATLCWPVVVVGFGCTMLLKLGDTLERCKIIQGRNNTEVGGSSAKEAAVGQSSKINRDIFEKTPPVSVVAEEGDIDSVELDLV